MIYQSLTNYYKVLYPDNLTARWYGDLRVGLARSVAAFQHAPHNSFQSHHGDTRASGEHAPNELAGFWYRWLSRDDHYADETASTLRGRGQVRQEILEPSLQYQMPLVLKNLTNGQRLRFIHACLPEARIVIVHRQTSEVVASMLRARRDVGIGAGHWWSVKPPHWREYLSLPEEEMVARQVAEIEGVIADDVKLFDEENVAHVTYSDFLVGLRSLENKWGLLPRDGGSFAAPQEREDIHHGE